VKKSLGPRSRGGGSSDGEGGESGGEGEDDAVIIVGIRLFEELVFEDEPFSRMYILGVRVAALPDLELSEERVLSLRCLKLDDGLVGSDKCKSGDERAEW
jgi:hypothetical protein